jgi:hypothetical protein
MLQLKKLEMEQELILGLMQEISIKDELLSALKVKKQKKSYSKKKKNQNKFVSSSVSLPDPNFSSSSFSSRTVNISSTSHNIHNNNQFENNPLISYNVSDGLYEEQPNHEPVLPTPETKSDIPCVILNHSSNSAEHPSSEQYCFNCGEKGHLFPFFFFFCEIIFLDLSNALTMTGHCQ